MSNHIKFLMLYTIVCRIIDFGDIDKFSVHELIILDEKNDEVRKISSRVNDLDLQLMKN